MAQEHHDRAYEVDLLRFVAAMSVLIFHYAFRGAAADGLSPLTYAWLMPAAQYGYLGVELFFMISGFVIVMSAADGSLRHFMVSRAVRLYPAFWACCTATALVLWATDRAGFHVSLSQFLANMTMASGFFSVPSVDGVYWSLFIEIRFYGLIAIVLALGWLPHLGALLWLWLAATTVQRMVHTGPLWSWLIAEYAPFFIAGASCYLLRRDGLRWSPLALFALSFPLALYQSMQHLQESTIHYRAVPWSAAWVIAGVSLVYLLMLGVASRRLRWLAAPRYLAVGALTYPLYLLHQNIGYALFNRWYGVVNTHLLFWGTTALMLGAAWSVHRFVERPAALALKTLLNRIFDRFLARHTSSPAAR